MKHSKLPFVGIVCDKEIVGPHAFHIAGDKYIQAIVDGSNCIPLLIPAIAETTAFDQLLGSLDGILLTGGYSMVDPLLYQNEAADLETKLDTARDGTTMTLARKAIDAGIPILGICRGFQEINVALGGSLHQKLHENGHFIEHRENNELTLEQQYSSSHKINLTENGLLAKMLGANAINVNSLHTQGIDRLADNLTIEALAEDGLVEAFSVSDAVSFAIAVQWHPEWQFRNNNNSVNLFNAFGQACKSRQKMRDNNG